MQSFMAGSRLGYGLLAKLANGIRPTTDLSKRGADLSRGPLASSKLPAAAWSNTWPAPASTLDLDFANNRGFVRGSGQGGAMDAVTFTRASSGNWVDNTGVLRTGARTFTGTANALGVNLVPSPQNFENAAWTKQGTTISSNSILAPDGSLSAYTVFENFAFSNHGVWQLITTSAGTTYTYSAYLKYFTRQYVRFAFVTGGGVQSVYIDADLINGTIVNQGPYSTATQAGASITNVGNGWYRVSVTGTLPSNTTYVTIYTKNNSSNSNPETAFQFSGDPNQGVYIWGAQLEVGSSATTYYPTNINAPRFDWASTALLPINLLRYSEQFNGPAWSNFSGVTFTSNTELAPNGSNIATLVSLTGNVSHSFRQDSITSNVKSIYAKAGTAGFISLSQGNNTQGYALFDLNNGTVAELTTGTAEIINVGNGWYRCVFFAPGQIRYSIAFGITAESARPQNAYNANGETIYIWGAQYESGPTVTPYFAQGAYLSANTPLVANSTCNGLLIEESRTNRILWCRDGLNGGTAVGTNLQAYSENYGTGWSVYNVTRTTGQTDPNATSNATLLTCNTTTGVHGLSYGTNSIPVGTNTVIAYAKPGTWNYISIGLNNATNYGVATFDLSNPTAATKTGSATYTVNSSSITSVGNGWYRLVVTITTTNVSGMQFWINSSATPTYTSGNESWTPAGTETVYVWGLQVLPYTYITDYQVTTSGAIYGWSKSNVTVAKTATGIDGVANAATTITATANNAVLIQPISLASGSRTGSVYLKRITGTGNVQVTLDGSTWSTVDLSNGIWNRIVLSGTVTNPCVGVLLATNGDAVAMDYAQVEDGAFVTSPILTTTATATRATEQFTLPTATWLEPSQGTFLNSCVGLGYTSANFSVLFIGAAGNNIMVDRTGAGARFRPTITISGVELSNNGNYGLLSTPYPYTITCAFSRSRFEPQINNLNASINLVTSPLPLDTLTCNSNRTRYVERLIYTPKILNLSAAANFAGEV